MTTAVIAATSARVRTSAWAAIASGAVGFIAFAFLAAAVRSMYLEAPVDVWRSRFAMHDAATVLQSLLMVPAAFALAAMGSERTSRARRMTLTVGLVALAAIVLCLALDLAGIIWDTWYMAGEGVLGVWLLLVVRLASLPRGLVRLGTVVGVGLLFVGSFPLVYAALVDPSVLHGPIDPLSPPPPGTETANIASHVLLQLGTLVGVTLYPLFCILLGRRLLREGAVAR